MGRHFVQMKLAVDNNKVTSLKPNQNHLEDCQLGSMVAQ